jgi:hypothetical protein
MGPLLQAGVQSRLEGRGSILVAGGVERVHLTRQQVEVGAVVKLPRKSGKGFGQPDRGVGANGQGELAVAR